MKKRLTKKRKEILLNKLGSSWALQALFNVDDFVSDYTDEFDSLGFKKSNGFTIEEAQEAIDALVEHLT